MERRFKPLRDRGITVWVSLALGVGGIIVTVLGIFEWTKRSAEQEQRAEAAELYAKRTTQANIALENARLRRELHDLKRQQQIDNLRRAREAAQQNDVRPENDSSSKCIGGRKFQKTGNEWREVGRC
ncbi:hypothetical protein [Marilutibacter chinensis]|uniref:Uncharacterized protein n=1 Tax=Marilutibacter chinensis TaxID=2912247 RepID=A0ABS9HQM1_9GAMM|nr:hypothetical protein [Lysobacter chinensis]MCF7220402.1 hypothetical protein [Lysobacter chinensis]